MAIVTNPPIHESPKVCLSQGLLYIYSHLCLVIIFKKLCFSIILNNGASVL
jgi:hypothetical protein